MEAEKIPAGTGSGGGSSSNQIGGHPAKVNTRILPGDVIEEILSRIPVKSLLRFRSVHKQWLSLISHPNFVGSNLKNFLSNQKLMVLNPDYFSFSNIRSCWESSDQFYSIDYKSSAPACGSSINPVTFSLPLSIPQTSSGNELLSIFGSCNGLLCIGIHGGDHGDVVEFIIWNPLLRNYKQVRVADFDHHDRSPSYIACVGYGYDSVADDYKIVSVDLGPKLVYVYILKTNNSRSFPLEHPALCRYSNCDGKLFNGSLYWLADDGNCYKLIWFDLKDEKFSMAGVPLAQDTALRYAQWGIELIVSSEGLCIVTMDRNNLHLNLLMMKVDKCNVISWSVGPTLEQPYGIRERPICITTDGGVLMRVKENFGDKDKRKERLKEVFRGGTYDCSNYKLIIYNPHKGTVENIPVQRLSHWDEDTIYLKSTTYLETLVSPIY